MHVRTPSVGTLGGLQTAPDVAKGPRREWRKPKPMMNGLKKSDEAVRPVRAANKGARASAESPEERASTKGNPRIAKSTRRTAVSGKRATGGEPDTESCREKPEGASHCALPPHHAGRAAPGVPRPEAGRCGGRRRHHVGHVWRRSGRALARPAPASAQRGSVPGAAGSAGRDTQAGRRNTTARDRGAGGQDRPESGCGCDPDTDLRGGVSWLQLRVPTGAGAHDALDALAFGIERRKVSWIADADLRAYFDTIPRDWLIMFLEHCIGDRRVIRLIQKWLNAGVMDGGSWTDAGMGTPQGAIVSPGLGERVPALRARPVVPQEMAPERPGWRSDHRPLRRRYRCRVPTQAGCGAVPSRRSGEAEPVRSQSSPGQDPPRGVRPVRGDEPSPARGGQAGDIRFPGLHALLHDAPERTLSAWSQTGRQTGQQDPGAHRRGAPQALAPRHLGGRKVARAGLRRLAQLLCRPGVGPVHPCVPPQATTPVDAGAAPAVPTRPLQLEASGAHDRNSLATSFNPPPMAGPAVCRQAPEVGAGWFSDHVRICAGGCAAMRIPTATGGRGSVTTPPTRPRRPRLRPALPTSPPPFPLSAGRAKFLRTAHS